MDLSIEMGRLEANGTHGAITMRASAIGTGEPSTVSGTLARYPLSWPSRSSRARGYQEPALPAGRVAMVRRGMSRSECVRAIQT